MKTFESALNACIASNLKLRGFSDNEKNILTVLNYYESTEENISIADVIKRCQDKLDKNLSN